MGMEDRDVWKTIGEMQGQIKETREAVFGYWDGPKRVKGLLENQTDLIDELHGWKEGVLKFGWSVAKPLIGLLAVLVGLGFIAVGVTIYLALHGGVSVKMP